MTGRRTYILGMVIAAIMMLPSAVYAQGPIGTQEAACTIDLSDATALMTKAQSKGSAGQVSEALALMDQVKAQIDAIQKQCGSAVTVLTESYTEPSGAFSINYPKGWTTQLLADTPTEQAKGPGPILFASDPAAFNMIGESKSAIKVRGIVIYLGTSGQLLEQMGVRGVSKVVSPLNVLTLLDRLVQGQSSGDGKFGTPIQGPAIADYATADVTFAFTDGSTVAIADGNVLLIQLGADQFAVLVGFAPPGQGKAIAELSRTMAGTLQVPAKAAK